MGQSKDSSAIFEFVHIGITHEVTGTRAAIKALLAEREHNAKVTEAALRRAAARDAALCEAIAACDKVMAKEGQTSTGLGAYMCLSAIKAIAKESK